MTIYIGLTTGPVIGGLLVQSFGWRSIFFVNIPIGLSAILLTLLFIKKDSTEEVTRQPFDFLGALALTSFLSLLLLILNDAGLDLTFVQSAFLFTACVSSLISFIYIEGRIAAFPIWTFAFSRRIDCSQEELQRL